MARARRLNAERRRTCDHDRRDNNRGRYRPDSQFTSTGDEYEAESTRKWGATASQLRHRNAAQASESGFLHASPDSNVGRIAAYRDAARATLGKEGEIDALDDELQAVRRQRDLATASVLYGPTRSPLRTAQGNG